MRNVLAVILATLAGVLSVVGLVSWKASELIRQPEPIQQVFGSGEAAEDFQAAVPGVLGGMAQDATGVAVVDEIINRAVTDVSGAVLEHDDFATAWEESLELTRSAWVAQIDQLREQAQAGEPVSENSTAAQLELRFDPVGALALGMAQDTVAEGISRLPGLEHISLDLDAEFEIAVPTGVPQISVLTAHQTVLAEEAVTLWPAMLGLAAIVLVMALIVGSPGSKWLVWCVTGLVGVLGAGALKFGLWWVERDVVAQTPDGAALNLVRPMLRAVQEWADPQVLVLGAAALGVLLVGVLGGFIAGHRKKRFR